LRDKGEIYRRRDILEIETDGKRQRRTDRGEQIERKRQKEEAEGHRQSGSDREEDIGGETYERWRDRDRREQIERKRQRGETGEETE
jgi:hypothetical protein